MLQVSCNSEYKMQKLILIVGAIIITIGLLWPILTRLPFGKLPLDFSTPYGCSKGSADQYFRDWSRVYGIKTVVFRHSSIYGGRQFASFDQGWVGWFYFTQF